MQELTLRPAGEWQPAAHGWTVLRVAVGNGYALQGSRARELNAGDAVITGPATNVIIRASLMGHVRLDFFQVLPQFLNGVITVAEYRQLEDVSEQSLPRVRHFSAIEPAAQKFTRLAAQSKRASLSSRSAMLKLWASEVLELLPAHHLPVTGGTQLRDRFHEFVGQMSEAELATRPLSELAAELHCSERHFSRLFREEFNVSWRTRQKNLRLQRASQLLSSSDSKIASVARECGYRHLGLFNTLFKKRFGMTPSSWRQKMKLAGFAFLLPSLKKTWDVVELTRSWTPDGLTG